MPTFKRLVLTFLSCLVHRAFVEGAPISEAADDFVTATLDGQTYVNQGMVGFGLIPSDFRDSTGDTMGGFGSAIALKLGTWQSNGDGTFSGVLAVHPDRGFNVNGTVDFQSRRHEIAFTLNPYTASADLNMTVAEQTLTLTYLDTILEEEREDNPTSGLDPADIRAAETGFGTSPDADPQMPIASLTEQHLTVDIEGMVLNADGTFWISDEYGPYIYRFTSDGHIIQTIQPPAAVLPIIDGQLNFTSLIDPDTGRAGNQGFEGLTVDPTTNTLYAMLQSATVQDGGSDKTTSRFTRLFAWNVSDPNDDVPALLGEWVVPLPVNPSNGNTFACSEIHFVSPNIFLALSRDGNGRGGSGSNSKYKQADLFSISAATNIAGSSFDDPTNPVAPGGVLDSSITPANYQSFLSLIDPTQLARFGLHNGKPDDPTLIDAKWESLALAPVNDPANPDDYFLFTVSDNDFMTEDGVSVGQPFDAGENVDNQFMVFRVTLPGASGIVQTSIGVQ